MEKEKEKEKNIISIDLGDSESSDSDPGRLIVCEENGSQGESGTPMNEVGSFMRCYFEIAPI